MKNPISESNRRLTATFAFGKLVRIGSNYPCSSFPSPAPIKNELFGANTAKSDAEMEQFLNKKKTMDGAWFL